MGKLEGAIEAHTLQQERSKAYADRGKKTAKLSSEKDRKLLTQFFHEHNPNKKSNLDLARKIKGSFRRLPGYEDFDISEKTVLNKLRSLGLLDESDKNNLENA